MSDKNTNDGPTNRYAQLVSINRTFSVSAATALLAFLILPQLQSMLGLSQLPVLTVLGATLAGSVLIARVLNRLSLEFELALLENVTIEELERKTKENLEYFRREMAKKNQPGSEK